MLRLGVNTEAGTGSSTQSINGSQYSGNITVLGKGLKKCWLLRRGCLSSYKVVPIFTALPGRFGAEHGDSRNRRTR